MNRWADRRWPGGAVCRPLALTWLLALAGCGDATVSASPGVTGSAPAAAPSPECRVDPAGFPEGQTPHPISFTDRSGRAIGCRLVGFEERESIIDTFGPPLPFGMTRGTIQVRRADAEGTALLVMWVVFGCDEDAQVLVSDGTAGVHVAVTQRSIGGCPPGAGLTTIEIAFREAISIEHTTLSIRHDAAP